MSNRGCATAFNFFPTKQKFFCRGRLYVCPFDATMLSGQPQGLAPTEHGQRYLKATAFGKLYSFPSSSFRFCEAGALVVIHKYVRTPKARYSCRDWECAYNGGQALPDLHELHRLPNSGRHLCITMRAGAWEPEER